MLLITQPSVWGSHPFFSATVVPAATPADTPHFWDGVTARISDSAYARLASDSTTFGQATIRTRWTWSGAFVDVSPHLSLIHISEPTRLGMISYAVFCLKK